MQTLIARIEGPLTSTDAHTFDVQMTNKNQDREWYLADACERTAYALLKGFEHVQHDHAWRAVAIARAVEA